MSSHPLTTFMYASKGENLLAGDTIHLTVDDEAAWGDLGKTLCGRSLEGMTFGDETQSGIAATCKTCKGIAHKRNWPPEGADHLGNRIAKEGCDRCVCGCKYWELDRCVDCGTHVTEIICGEELVMGPTEGTLVCARMKGHKLNHQTENGVVFSTN